MLGRVGHRRRSSKPWAVVMLLAADAVVFVLYALSGSLAVLAAGVVGLLAIVVAVLVDRVGRRGGRHRRAADPAG
jgi:hypothetical protein